MTWRVSKYFDIVGSGYNLSILMYSKQVVILEIILSKIR